MVDCNQIQSWPFSYLVFSSNMSYVTLPLPSAVWALAVSVGFRSLKLIPNMLFFQGKVDLEAVLFSKRGKGAYSGAMAKMAL